MSARHRALALVLLASLLVAGCGDVAPTATPLPATATRAALGPTSTLSPRSATPTPPTPTVVPPPATDAPLPLSTATRVPPTAVPPATPEPAPLLSLESSPQPFGNTETFQVGLGDLDGDGDLDAVFANMGTNDSQVWFNDGGVQRGTPGRFTDSGQRLTQQGHGLDLGDLDGDGDLDILIVCAHYGRGGGWSKVPSRVYLNDGQGTFHDTGQDLGDTELSANGVNLVDVDGDGDLDAHVVYYEVGGMADRVYLNDGAGRFSDSGLALEEEEIAWGDLDGDGDIDILAKAYGEGYRVLLNDGTGQFATGWQEADSQAMYGDLALADLDGDGDLDALIASGFRSEGSYPTRLLWNDGTGQFTDSGQELNETLAARFAVGDLNGDKYPDVFVSNMDHLPGEAWLNGGTGRLVDSGLRLESPSRHLATWPSLGDLDGDGDLDLVEAGFQGSAEVWLNSTALASDEGAAGQIAFVSRWDIYLVPAPGPQAQVNADGTGVRQLTTHPGRDAWPTWSPDGRQLAFMSERNGRWNVYVMDVQAGESSVRRLTSSAGITWEPAWSPDGAWIAFGSPRSGSSDIYLADADLSGGGERRLTDHSGVDGYPAWSPDSAQIAFVSDRDGNWEIYVMPAPGPQAQVDVEGSVVRRLTDHDADDWDPDWSPDGTQIAFASGRDGNMEIYVMAADGSAPRRLTDDAADDMNPSWSPDGKRIAFHREAGGHADIYLVDPDGSNLQRLATGLDDGSNPVWRPEPAALPAYVPRYEPAGCQFPEPAGYQIECGYLTVPEDRNQPQGAQIRLHTAVIHSTGDDPEPDPVVHLVGGPGGSLLDGVEYYLEAGGDEILKTRDYVMFNQRGTRYAEPFLACPGRNEFQWALAGQGLTLEERNGREVAFLLDCQDDLLDQGIHLAAYNSAENAADVNDLRLALGYGQVNLYGISYGSRLALTVMRDHPEGVRSAIIDAVFPPQANLNQEITPNVHRALQAVFADCAADPNCNQSYPDLEATFYQVVDELNSEPVTLDLHEGTVVVDGYVFLEAFFRLLYSKDAIPWIPTLVHQADEGAFPEPAIFAVPDRSTSGTGMHYAIWCREEMAFESQEAAFARAAELPAVLGEFFAGAYEWAVCASWQAGAAAPIEDQAVASDIPTLVLSGRYDPVTPPAWGRLAAETLANSFFYEFPNVAHGTMRSDPCALEIGLQFLDDPTAEPDASCLDPLGSPAFK